MGQGRGRVGVEVGRCGVVGRGRGRVEVGVEVGRCGVVGQGTLP